MLRRKIEPTLNAYYDDPDAKILVIDGARQTGKSYIIRETASKRFPNYIEIDLRADFEGEQMFLEVNTTKAFYLLISSLYGNKLDTAENTIIFLDEIAYYPNLLSMAKDLKKENRFRYVFSGSLLGVTLKHAFIPMGSIHEVKMYPLDFEEFLWANNVGQETIDYLKDCFEKRKAVDDSVHKVTLSFFKDYLIAGGLPDAVNEYVINRNVARTRAVQSETFSYYKDDCSKYDLEHKLKIVRIYEMILSNMENKVKRIQFKQIENKVNSNLEKYEDEFDYLMAAGVALGTKAVANPCFPLDESMTKNLIKLYYNDVGILTNLLYRHNIKAILDLDSGVNLGSVYEAVCAQELMAHGHSLFYFDNKKTGEVDFLINDYDALSPLPIEIKSGKNQTNFRAIPKLVNPEGNYKLPYGYVFGNQNKAETKNGLVTLPIYMIMFL